MTVYEWLAIGLAFLAQVGGLGRLILAGRETAQKALSETEKNKLRIESLGQHLARGTEKFDQVARQIDEMKTQLAGMESQMTGMNETLTWLKRRQNGGSE